MREKDSEQRPQPTTPTTALEALYVVERLSTDCTHWSPVEFGSFVAEQKELADDLLNQFVEHYRGKRQFRLARYVRDDQ